ncbi:biotin--[acetyl-CoA-carboxylase] ligase [Brochothrix campestris]|uniref:Bifunctional ligase/repressor BirA n=1 Tax=Brochothrix campestris FSL F6-1037 TaxID=1265861 RepID=W7CQN5_9LIST|nr:biotin--[acetyl-CoA-carboxylase] ligase [Brochothrix campestris]EUJ38031.1 bifunctional protein BirA [Brochothrix campestris FSL F6-1037]
MKTDIRKALLELFSATETAFVSGQTIADHLNCSRTAVWKHMNALKEEGFLVEAVRNKGYRLEQNTDQISENELYLGLKTTVIGQKIVYHPETSSTQLIAQQLLHQGTPEGTLVVTNFQTAGRGRLSRVWLSQPGDNIAMSLILKPQLSMQQFPQLTFLASVSIVAAIKEVVGIDAQIKWPNDIFIDGKKVCGVLTELVSDPEEVKAVIIGMGINVNQADFAPEIKTIATSLRLASGETLQRSALIQAILTKFEAFYQQYLTEGFAPIKRNWEEHALQFNKHIKARSLKGVLEGEFKGITDDGVLVLQDANDELHYVYSADIEV